MRLRAGPGVLPGLGKLSHQGEDLSRGGGQRVDAAAALLFDPESW